MLARCRAAVLLAAALLLPAAPLAAVDFSGRLHLALPAQWEPTIGAALLLSVPVGAPPQPTPSPGGGSPTLGVRNWFVHALAGAALNTGDVDTPHAFAHVGLVRRTPPGFLHRAGLMVTGSLGPKGLGPAVRLEAVNGHVGLQAGWMWLEGNRNGPSVSVEVSLSLIGDIFRH